MELYFYKYNDGFKVPPEYLGVFEYELIEYIWKVFFTYGEKFRV